MKLQQILGFDEASPSELGQLIEAARGLAASLNRKPASDQLTVLHPVLAKVVIGVSDITIDIKPQQLVRLLQKPAEEVAAIDDVAATPPPDHRITLPMRLGRRGNETRLIL